MSLTGYGIKSTALITEFDSKCSQLGNVIDAERWIVSASDDIPFIRGPSFLFDVHIYRLLHDIHWFIVLFYCL